MKDLTEFLLARIAETEDAARYCLDLAAKYYPAEDGFTVTWDWSMHTSNVSGGSGSQFMRLEGFDPARVLAECEAKRRIVKMHSGAVNILSMMETADNGSEHAAIAVGLMRATVVTSAAAAKCIALPYADHPDYREEWRPEP